MECTKRNWNFPTKILSKVKNVLFSLIFLTDTKHFNRFSQNKTKLTTMCVIHLKDLPFIYDCSLKKKDLDPDLSLRHVNAYTS